MHHFRWIPFLLFFFLSLSSAVAQKLDQRYTDWFTYFGQYKLPARWGVHLDAQFRTDGQVQRVNQSLLRIGAQYYLRPSTTLTLGYALVNSYNTNVEAYFTEHRVWQQYMHQMHLGNAVSMTHRFRLEQRRVERLGQNSVPNPDWVMGGRVRYFNRTVFNLTERTDARFRPYFAAQNEFFINFAASNINRNTFDQNRLLLALGFLHGGHTRFEVGYLNQYVNPPGNAEVVNHVLHFSILQFLDFSTQPQS